MFLVSEEKHLKYKEHSVFIMVDAYSPGRRRLLMVIMVMVVDDNAGDKGSDDDSGVADEELAAMVMLTAVMLMLVVIIVVLSSYGHDGGADLGRDDDNSHWEGMRPLVEKIFIVYQRLC